MKPIGSLTGVSIITPAHTPKKRLRDPHNNLIHYPKFHTNGYGSGTFIGRGNVLGHGEMDNLNIKYQYGCGGGGGKGYLCQDGDGEPQSYGGGDEHGCGG